MVQQVSSSTDYDTLINASEVALVDFYADWAVAPVIESMEQEYEADKKNVKFLKVNVDEMQDLSVKLGISAMPTFLIYHKGDLTKTIVGANVPVIKSVLAELSVKPDPVEEQPVVA